MCVHVCLCACPLIMFSICLELINSGLARSVKYLHVKKEKEKEGQ